MGCHTYFFRPLTEIEFSSMKDHALEDIENLCGPTEFNVKTGIYDKELYNALRKSYYDDLPCVCDKFWWQWVYGESAFGDRAWITELCGLNGLYICERGYDDLFRVPSYPKRTIKNRRELRKVLRKKYFNLSDEQLQKVSEFFRKNPGGVIVFG